MKIFLWAICGAWEIIYKNIIRARFLKDSEHRLLRVAYRKHKGPDKELDGELIKKGDLLAELHLSNLALSRYSKKQSPEWALYRDIITELRLFRQQLQAEGRPVKAMTGITILAPAAARMGFTVEEIPSGIWSALNYVWLRLLRIAFSPKKTSDIKSLDTKRKPVEMWISAKKFAERF